MHIVLLKFGPNRSQAAQWMSGHKQWIEKGISDGVFLLAGSLENAQGGALLAVKLSKIEVTALVEEDPFVKHQVVEPEIISIAPSRMTEGIASLLA
ncbi:hypothetical protein [Acidovorax sp.]|uniref:YciI family protein n=1 Tax=Acidovorax sp. TaxID=1872122 RepID=UPI002ACD8AC1|nr:hypothetical protein [Acidovorax sp.]MDZ7863936.1 hypothetical protein [Acidovorax sp.]